MRRGADFSGLLKSSAASSLAEFAISLPLLVVLVVGIFDFGGAFNQKQQLSNAMREAARFGASEATNDLAVGPAPPSVDAIRTMVSGYLVAARLPDCGLGSQTASTGPPWVYTASGGCPGPLPLILTIRRDPPGGAFNGSPSCSVTATGYGSPNPIGTLNMACTNVSIAYPYQWHFNSVIQLLVPGATLALSTITASATAVNMN